MDDANTRKRNLVLFPLGSLGRDMVYALVTNFLLTFILFTRSLDARQLAAVTAIMIAARIFDALNDPVMGNIIERTRTRWGKFKPWLVAGILSTSVVVYLVFSTDLAGWSFVLFFAVFYFCYSIAYTMHDISYWGMIPALGGDIDTRNRLTARATLFAGIGGTLANILIPMFTSGRFAIGGSAKIAFSRIALIVCILAPLFLLFTILGVREDRSDQKKAAPPVSFRKIVGTIRGNDQLIWAALALLLQQIGNGIVLSGVGATYIYFEFGYSGGLYSIFTTVGMSATAFLMIFYPAISRHISRKRLVRIMSTISVVGYVLTLVPGLLMPSSSLLFVLITVGYLLSNFGLYGLYLIFMISIMNTVEYNELNTGERDEAIISSLRPFITKLSSAVTVLFATVCYIVFGITGYTNGISDFENAAASGAISEAEKLQGITEILAGAKGGECLRLLVAMTVVPCILLLLSAFIYNRKYRIDEGMYDDMLAELEKRMGSGEN